MQGGVGAFIVVFSWGQPAAERWCWEDQFTMGDFCPCMELTIMGNRLTQIATRTGDNGTTGLGDNASKDSLRVHAMGDVDELNSTSACCCANMPEGVRTLLVEYSTNCSTWAGSCPYPATNCSNPRPCWRWTRHWPSTTNTCRVCRNSSCPPAPVPHHKPTCAAPWRPRRTCRGGTGRAGHAEGHAAPACLNRLSDLMFVLSRVLNRYRTDGKVGDDVYWKERADGEGGGGGE